MTYSSHGGCGFQNFPSVVDDFGPTTPMSSLAFSASFSSLTPLAYSRLLYVTLNQRPVGSLTSLMRTL